MRKWLYYILIIILFIFFITGCETNDSTIQKVENDANGNESTDDIVKTKKNNDIYQLEIGESVQFEDIIITLNDVYQIPDGKFESPKNDYFLVANLTAENNSNDEFIVSALLNVTLTDDQKNAYTPTILTEGTSDFFDGSVDEGETLKGDIPFDVKTSDVYELTFSNPFQTGEAIWIFEHDDVKK